MLYLAFFVLQAVALAPLLVSARPYPTVVQRWANSSSSGTSGNASSTDLTVLKFADVLERIETSFYTQVSQSFNDTDYTNAGYVSAQVPLQQLARILIDESTHAAFLNTTIQSLGGTPIPGCQYDFSGVLTDVPTVIATARVIELTGAGAYLGSAHLLTDPSILTTAATIATVETRHQSILNALGNGTAIPQSFDFPLLPQEALSLAGGFLSGCNPGFTGFPALSASTNGTLAPGALLEFESTAFANVSDDSFSCQTLIAGQTQAIPSPISNCTVPVNASGPFFVWITNSSLPLSADVVLRAESCNISSIVAGPDIVFVDDHPEALGSIIFGGNATV